MPPKGAIDKQKQKRNKKIAWLALEGYSLRRLAREYGLGPTRVHQVLVEILGKNWTRKRKAGFKR